MGSPLTAALRPLLGRKRRKCDDERGARQKKKEKKRKTMSQLNYYGRWFVSVTE